MGEDVNMGRREEERKEGEEGRGDKNEVVRSEISVII
jgi:hypothetical protein